MKTGTSDARKDWFAVGDYKKLPNEVGGRDTALPEEVSEQMRALLAKYNAKRVRRLKIFWIFMCVLKGFIRFRMATDALAG